MKIKVSQAQNIWFVVKETPVYQGGVRAQIFTPSI